MSRRTKKRDERQKQTSAPPVGPKPPKARKCDDELTTIAEAMRPAHRRFADAVLAGRTAAAAAVAAGFSQASARSIAWRLLRRDDVRRYIRLVQREEAVASRVSIDALVERLWRTVTDENATARLKEQALKHLVRIFVARSRGPEDEGATDGGELTDARLAELEAGILGVRR